MSRVVVVGGGPAGMAAAIHASEAGAEVSLIDENPSPGGQIWRGNSGFGKPWFERFRKSKIHALFGSKIVSADPSSQSLLVERGTSAHQMRFDRLILATGARELFLPFPGWTLPGVAGVGGLQALVKGGLPIGRKRIVVAGTGPLLVAAAHFFRTHGAEVVLTAEQAPNASLAKFAMELARHPGKLRQAAHYQMGLLGVPYWRNTWVERAEGNGTVQRVCLRSGSRQFTEEVHFAAIAYGLYPNSELAAALGCNVAGSRVTVNELRQTSVENIYCAGEATGIGGVDLSLVEGEIAGRCAGGNVQAARKLIPQMRKEQRFATALATAFALRSELKSLCSPDTIVCRCEDVQYRSVAGQTSFRAAKLHTRCGMGPCQGRICGAAADFLFGWRTESIRPPIVPARIGTLATTLEAPTRQ